MKTKEKYVAKQLLRLGYRCISQCRADLVATLRLYRSLAPCAETYVFDSGEMAQLLNLGGTIPIMYKEQNYNIPIKIWLPCSYPEEPPFCYVLPTREMELSVSPILQIARATFSETPP